jgi:hypothetical protein
MPTKIFKKHLIKEKKVAWFKSRNSALNKQVKLRAKEAEQGFERSRANDVKKNPKRINAYIKTIIIRALRDKDDNIITDAYAIADFLNYFATVFVEKIWIACLHAK